MKFRFTFMLCMAALAILAAGCGTAGDRMESGAGIQENVRTEEPVETVDTLEEAETETDVSASTDVKEAFREKFYGLASDSSDMTETDISAMYRKIEDSKIPETTAMSLTGAAFGDYDRNGVMDMILCLYEDKEDSDGYADGCLYLFMNDDAPFYIYDDFCCYWGGYIFGDFGADIDDDGSTEIVFCVQGTGNGGAGDCQKFVFKYGDNEIERMTLPSDLTEEYDSGLNVEIKRDAESGNYNIYCPYLDESIVLETAEATEDYRDGGANCRGYCILEREEQDGRGTWQDANTSMQEALQTPSGRQCLYSTGMKTEKPL